MASALLLSNFTTNSYLSSIFGTFQQDTVFNSNFLQIQSNILSATNTMYTDGLTIDSSLGIVSDQLREILASYESITNQMAYESFSSNLNLNQLFFQV